MFFQKPVLAILFSLSFFQFSNAVATQPNDPTNPQCTNQLTNQIPKNLKPEENIPWLPIPNRATWILSDSLPTDAKVTAAYVLAQKDGNFLMGHHRERGWDITGGHIEENESPEQAAKRETLEETGAEVHQLKLIAYQKLEIFSLKPENYKYPYPVSYQALFIGEISKMGMFQEEEDMTARALFSPKEATKKVPWIQRHPELFEAAVNLSTQN